MIPALLDWISLKDKRYGHTAILVVLAIGTYTLRDLPANVSQIMLEQAAAKERDKAQAETLADVVRGLKVVATDVSDIGKGQAEIVVDRAAVRREYEGKAKELTDHVTVLHAGHADQEDRLNRVDVILARHGLD